MIVAIWGKVDIINWITQATMNNFKYCIEIGPSCARMEWFSGVLKNELGWIKRAPRSRWQGQYQWQRANGQAVQNPRTNGAGWWNCSHSLVNDSMMAMKLQVEYLSQGCLVYRPVLPESAEEWAWTTVWLVKFYGFENKLTWTLKPHIDRCVRSWVM